jgi:ribosomal-protein-alanine N-acetyltransferase
MTHIDTEAIIETDNLRLEPIQVHHAIKLFDLLQSMELYRFIPHDPPKNIEKLENRYRRWAQRASDDGQEIWLNYAVYKPHDAEYVGTLQATIQNNEYAYIAYEVFPHMWRRGIAREGCVALLDLLLNGYKLKKIVAHTDTRNMASQRLLQSLGFQQTQTILGADEFKGSISDEYVFEYYLA